MFFDERLIKAFHVLAQELHYGRASQRLFISQPPLSQRIKRLESELGVTLFRRSTRAVQLTEAGKILYERLQVLSAETDAIGKAVRQASEGARGSLQIGLTPSAAYATLPRVMHAFLNRYPAVELDVVEMPAEAITDALRQQRLDLALMRPTVTAPDFQPVVVHTEPVMLALRADHALAKRRYVTKNMLAELDFIGYSEQHSRYFSELFETLAKLIGQPLTVIQKSTVPSILTLVEAGIGAAFVPASLSRLRGEEITYLPVRGLPKDAAQLIAVTPPDGATPATENFLSMLRERMSA